MHNMTEKYTMGVISNYIIVYVAFYAFPETFGNDLRFIPENENGLFFVCLMLNLNKYRAGKESVLYL